MFPGKARLQLLGNEEEERRLDPFPSLLDTNPHNARPPAFPVILPQRFHFS